MVDSLRRALGPVPVVAVLSVLTVTQVDHVVARSLAGFLLVFILPGLGLTVMLFPADRPGWIERGIAAVALSLGVSIVGGFVLHLSPWGLTQQSWALLLGGLTVVCDLGRHTNPGWRLPTGLPSRTAAIQGVALLSAAMITVGAFVVAVQGVVEQPRQGFTVLWGQPAATPSGESVVRLGVSNSEGVQTTYDLRAEHGGVALGEWTSIQLQQGEAWAGVIALPSTLSQTAPIVASLYRTGSDTVYRQVLIWPAVAPQ